MNFFSCTGLIGMNAKGADFQSVHPKESLAWFVNSDRKMRFIKERVVEK